MATEGGDEFDERGDDGNLGNSRRGAVAVALALAGAMLGFAYFNRPAAGRFLGDVRSLPSGIRSDWLLALLADDGQVTAALLLPLYYFANATLTLIRRLSSGQKIWQAHRMHCYHQHATDRGFTVTEFVALLFAVNNPLGMLAVISVLVAGIVFKIAALVAGGILVTWVLVAFSRGRK